MSKNKVFFLDRDGVINEEVGYLHQIEKFKFIDGVIDALRLIQNKGYKIIIITNQSGIGRGYYSKEDFLNLNNWMLDYLRSKKIEILQVFYCPHSPNENCDCRKPKTTLFNNAQMKFNIDMSLSWAAGDKESDIIAAKSAGVANTVLVRSGHIINEAKTRADFIIDKLIGVDNLQI